MINMELHHQILFREFGAGRAISFKRKGNPRRRIIHMSDERHDVQNVVVAEEAAAPRWIGIVVVTLAIVSLVALGIGWSASNHSKSLEQSVATQEQQTKQSEDIFSQRLAKAEDNNAQLAGELSVVTDKMKLTEGELAKARLQAKKIKDDDA